MSGPIIELVPSQKIHPTVFSPLYPTGDYSNQPAQPLARQHTDSSDMWHLKWHVIWQKWHVTWWNWHVTLPTWHVTLQKWHVTEVTYDRSDMWQKWHMTEVTCDITEMTCGITDMTCDITDMTCDIIDMTCDITCDMSWPCTDFWKGGGDLLETCTNSWAYYTHISRYELVGLKYTLKMYPSHWETHFLD